MKRNFNYLVKILSLYCLLLAINASDESQKKDSTSNEEIEGLKITTIKEAPSCDRKAKNGDQLTVHYDGYLVNGKEFDSSRKRNQPFVITLGKGMVIPGWEKGLVGTCEGEQRKLEIAPELAYGDQGFADLIPPRSTLIFNIELLKLNDGQTDAESSEENLDIEKADDETGLTDDLFSEIDADSDKHISVEEMANHLIKHEGKSEKDDTSEVYTMVGEIFQEDDKNKDGVLSYDEFMAPSNEHDEL